ncbi:Choline dehydrogenase [Enhygromyxa salina]|uniref:Cholesterol oxidase n=1 Tax=Enhygromyxa salina TaxID=215803 RepID=A0A0C2D8Q7_9BACT|nr:GMC oxidoreductase [Enhygromyxa salina]KIG19471.1 Choline dehydrogenase [Enhygromyxa salina]
MARLASKLSELKQQYTVVVVGSGYGGGIAASRLARAGQQVCVLERGREYLQGEFPNTELEAAKATQVSGPTLPKGRLGSKLALFDWHVEPEFNVLTGCGLGGTSLINANVALEADPKVFELPAWPAEIGEDHHARLRQGYARTREMLAPSPYPTDWPTLPKLEAHARSAKQMGEKLTRVPIAVSFRDHTNPFGVEQSKCALCGDCVTGCNHGAKNTVATTYLPDAWNHGAELFCEVEVSRVEARKDGLWAVHYTPLGRGTEAFQRDGERVVLAQIVVLAAGTLGSTRILLRSRAAGLPTSSRLGHGFSGNADVIGFGYNNDVRINAVGAGRRAVDPERPIGPTITAAIDGRIPPRPLDQQFVIEEAVLPGAIDAIYPAAFSYAAAVFGQDTDPGAIDSISEAQRELRSRLPGGARYGAIANTQTYLGMAVDSSDGRLRLDERERLRIDWPQAEREPIIAALNKRMFAATAALGGTYVPNPLWSNHLQSSLITVHPLGGCSMGDDASVGVTNHKGQVFRGPTGAEVHPNLYVADGAVIPTALGVNPLLTICAVAERSVALLAEAHGWQINYDLHHRPVPPRQPAPPAGIGISFTERMAGFLAPASPDTTHHAAHDQGKRAANNFAFVLTLLTEDLDATLRDPGKRMILDGVVEAPWLSPRPLQVSEGQFALLSSDPDHLDTTNMIYTMQLTANDGRRWAFRGVKYVHDDRGPDLWGDTTTLLVDLTELPNADGQTHAQPQLSRGLLRIEAADFAKQLTTMEVTGTKDAIERLRAKTRFGRFFAGKLFDTYADVFARPSVFDPTAPPRERRPLRTGPPEVHYFFTSDEVQLCLTRYRGGGKGPVILAHGLGVSSRIFTVDTIDTNLVEYLYAHGYDVWLLDYRASIELAASAQQASADVMAQIDFPQAVAKVQRVTGAPSVQMVVHCFGSTVFFMSMLSGALTGVRAAVASQTAAHIEAAGLVRLKSGLHLPKALDALGVQSLTAYTDSDARWFEKLYDKALELYPLQAEERCASATCHRITFMYSLLYEHDQLNVATHETLHELFGVASVSAFEQLASMVRARRIVDAEGRDVYFEHPENLAIPLRIIHGAENACYLPTGTKKTVAWLREHNNPDLYSHVVIPDFGHIDCIFGERAVTEVYPSILAHLEANL